MTDFEETLPLQRTFVERHIGQLVGIFQIDSNQLRDRSQARSLATEGMVGLVAVADGGKLSETAFNVWTVASHWFTEAGCPDTNRLDFTLGAFARRLWGEGGRSATKRKRLAAALSELMRTNVVVVGIDPYTLEPAENSVWELNLLEAAGVRGEWQKVFDASRRGDRSAQAKLATLAARGGEEGDERSTWSMVLPQWLADSVRRGHGVILDYDIQRALRGSAKRIWVQLETHVGWTDHELLADEDPAALLNQLPVAGELHSHVLPHPDEATVTVQTLTVPLDSETYEAFGLTHANRKRDLQAACHSILSTDPTYLRAEILPAPRSKRRFELHLVRATGALRQQQLRKRLRQSTTRQREATSTAA